MDELGKFEFERMSNNKNPDLPLEKSTPTRNPSSQFFTSIHKMGPPAFHSHHSWFLIMSASFQTHLY